MLKWLWNLLEAFDDPQPCLRCESLGSDLDATRRELADAVGMIEQLEERIQNMLAIQSPAGIDTTSLNQV